MYTYQYTIFRLKPHWVPIAAEHVDYDTIIAEPMIEGIEFIAPSVITNIHQYIQIKYPHLTPLFLHSKFDQNGTTMAHTIAKGSAISVTDASVSLLSQQATVSWIITDLSSNMCGEGLAVCPTLYHSCDSYGSKLFGIYCIVTMTRMVTEFYNVQHGSLVIACDNDASLDSGTNMQDNAKVDQHYYDMIWEISDTLKALPITIQKKCQRTYRRF